MNLYFSLEDNMKMKILLKAKLPLHLLLALCVSVHASPDADPSPDADAAPDLSVPHLQDPEDPDFSGVVDFSSATPGPDGSWCITKVKYVDHMESDQVKECWHQNVTQCHDTYITEFLPSQEQKCEESFWKSCKIDFKEVPFNYSLKQCHTPLIKKCDDFPQEYGAPQKTVCRTWFESECNTTYVESPSGDHKPNTWCQKMPRKICAPDNCNMVQGPEDCRDKTMVSTIQKPEEHCELQPQRHCRLITKLVPHLTTKEVCKGIPKEICVLKLVNPHPVKKPIQLKWCTKKKSEVPQYKPSQPSYGAPQSATNNYLPPQQQQGPPQYQPKPSPSYEQFNGLRRESGSGTSEDPFVITVDGEKFAELNELPPNLSQIISSNAPLRREQFRQVREQPDDEMMLNRPSPNTFQRKIPSTVHKRHTKPISLPHMKPGHHMQDKMYHAASETKVHIVKPQPGGNNAHRVTPSKSQQPAANTISVVPTPEATKATEMEESETTPKNPVSTQTSVTKSESNVFRDSPFRQQMSSIPMDVMSSPTLMPVKPTAFAPPLTSYSLPPQAPTSYAPPPTYNTPESSRLPRARSSTQQTFTASSLRNHPGSIF